jgi:hypothetical protein
MRLSGIASLCLALLYLPAVALAGTSGAAAASDVIYVTLAGLLLVRSERTMAAPRSPGIGAGTASDKDRPERGVADV